jgi:hypothetical protein
MGWSDTEAVADPEQAPVSIMAADRQPTLARPLRAGDRQGVVESPHRCQAEPASEQTDELE